MKNVEYDDFITMNETQRPFACAIEGCEMTFTNEDHLNWHRKKHDMVLNLGLSNKNTDTDQTPTPTRFIRNCEEVGLFQDLQNVNPFDETFKKAIEYTKSGSLHVPQSTNDDTLHTPHIFPPVDDNLMDNRNDNSQSRQSSDFSITVPSMNQNSLSIDATTPLSMAGDKAQDLKHKLKQVIQNKEKTNHHNRPLVITPVPLARLLSDENNCNTNQRETKNKSNSDDCNVDNVQDESKEKLRQMNRAAQSRCRKRKQQQFRKLGEDLRAIKADNANLHTENLVLKQKMTILKSIILKYKQTSKSDLLTDLEKALSTPIKVVKKAKASPESTTIPIGPNNTVHRNGPVQIAPIIPVTIGNQATQTPHKPVLIQVVGSVSQLAVSLLPK